MWYDDGEPCDYFGSVAAKVLMAAGWLEGSCRFDTGSVEQAFVDRLSLLLKQTPGFALGALFMGVHECSVCEGKHKNVGASNLFVPDYEKIWVCPELILHYIQHHHYRPPDLFQKAVMACPDLDSPEYEQAIFLANGKLINDRGNYGQ